MSMMYSGIFLNLMNMNNGKQKITSHCHFLHIINPHQVNLSCNQLKNNKNKIVNFLMRKVLMVKMSDDELNDQIK
jgi:hypothetical protein